MSPEDGRDWFVDGGVGAFLGFRRARGASGTASVDRRNRTNAVLRDEVHHDDGRLPATAVGSYAIFSRRR